MLERLQSLAKNETFQAKVQQMASNPEFMQAAGQYAEEMKEELVEEAKAADALDGTSVTGLDADDELEDEDDEDDEAAV